MDTEYEKARLALDMFCRAAEKETGDFWEIQQMENGDLAVVQTFRAAKETMDDPKIPDEEKKLMVTGVLFCMSSGGLADLANNLVLTFSRGHDGWVPSLPLPFLSGCASVEEMAVRLAACC
jgi:hypothetical protein